jgi:hypothetical protein
MTSLVGTRGRKSRSRSSESRERTGSFFFPKSTFASARLYPEAHHHNRSSSLCSPRSLPSNDIAAHYVGANTHSPSGGRSSSPHPGGLPRPTRTLPRGNRGIKLEPDGVLQKRGRMYAWSPMVVEDLYGNPYGYGDELRSKEREEEVKAKKRFKMALHFVLPAAAMEAGQPLKGDELKLEDEDSHKKKKRKTNVPPHLRSPSPVPKREEIIESLSRLGTGPEAGGQAINQEETVIGTTYLDLATSPAVRYTLGVANKERALMRTVDDLIDGETGLKGVLSRLQSALEVAGREPSRLFETKQHREKHVRTLTPDKEVLDEIKDGAQAMTDVQEGGPSAIGVESAVGQDTVASNGAGAVDASASATITDVKMEVEDEVKPKSNPASRQPSLISAKPALDSSFLFGSGEPFFVPPGSMVTYEPVDPKSQDPDVLDVYPETELSPLQKLFVTQTGLTTTIGPSPNDPRLHLPLTHPGYPHTTCVRLTPETQKQSVICAMDKIKELASDCQEYVRRLEEIRERLANVGRARRKVWQIVRERAVIANDGEVGDGEADIETMRLRAEAEHAISGTQVETRRRRGVATAVASAVAS